MPRWPRMPGHDWQPEAGLRFLVIAARAFMVAVNHRRLLVFGLVVLAALVATGANVFLLKTYINWEYENSDCETKLTKIAVDRTAESQLKKVAGERTLDDDLWHVSAHAEGHSLIFEHHFKKPVDPTGFSRLLAVLQQTSINVECNDQSGSLKRLSATQTFIFYSVDGQRLTSFSTTPADCPGWSSEQR
jgi:hypothetical protein